MELLSENMDLERQKGIKEIPWLALPLSFLLNHFVDGEVRVRVCVCVCVCARTCACPHMSVPPYLVFQWVPWISGSIFVSIEIQHQNNTLSAGLFCRAIIINVEKLREVKIAFYR